MAVLIGTISAMALQSSTAVTLICTSFVSKKIMPVAAGIAVVLGADIGTTLAAQILIFDMSWLVPVLLICGYVATQIKTPGGTIRYVGRALFGIALILLSLEMVVSASEGFRESEALKAIIQPLSKEPLLAIIIGALITWGVHSSLAIVLLFASFAGSGVIPLYLAFVLVLGANLGGAFIAYSDTLSEEPRGRRLPMANVIVRLLGVIAFLPFIDVIKPYLDMATSDLARQIVHFHMGFNIVVAVVGLIFLSPLTAISSRLLKEDDSNGNGKYEVKYLDKSALTDPSSALYSAMRETLRMSDLVREMLDDTRTVISSNNTQLLMQAREADHKVDFLYGEIKRYLTQIDFEDPSARNSQQNLSVLTFSTNLEHAGDVIDKSLLELCEKRIRKDASFSEEGLSEIEDGFSIVLESLSMAQNLFMREDLDLARRLFEQKTELRRLGKRSTELHMQRYREGDQDTLTTSSMHLDIFRDLLRVQSYISAISYPILEQAGELHETRLKSRD